jgi:hypothetical protein
MAVVNSSKMNFAEVVRDMLEKQYYPQVVEVTTQVIGEVAKESVKKLKQGSPQGKSGKYAKGWTSKVETGRLTTGATVYGKHGTYQLAHLLENGHARRGGGRNVDGITHIKPVEEWAIEETYQRIYERLEGLP